MAHYGNILIIYDAGNQQLEEVKKILKNNNTDHEQVEASFFVETTSLDNTANVVKDLTALGASFLFFHNRISDGSLIRTSGIEDDTVTRINDILFK